MKIIADKYGSVKDRYKNYLKTKEGVETYNEFKDILYNRPDSLIETLFSRYISKLGLKEAITICDVGGGDGKRIIDLTNKIRHAFNCRVDLDFIEQSGLMCRMFSQSIKRTGCFNKAKIFNSQIENSQLQLQDKYDIVFLIHSIFCFNSFSIIQKLYNRLNKNGVLVLLTNSGESFLGTLKSRLDSEYADKRYELTDLRLDLDRNGFEFSESSFDTNIVIKENQLEENISVILRWLSLGEYDSLDFWRKTSAIEAVRQLGKHRPGEYLFTETEKVLLLRR
jgi:hypothetical protein